MTRYSARLLFRTLRPALSRYLTVISILVCTSAGAHAQMINPFPGYRGPTLSELDLESARAAAGRLLGSEPKPVGAVEKWAGPKSGNSGMLTVERAYRSKGHDCRDIRSRITYKAGTERSFLLHACRVSEQWKLVN
jgi:surface antigen